MNLTTIAAPGSFPRIRQGLRRGQCGFSLLEMTIVVALIFIVGGIAMLLAQEVMRSVHLQQTAVNYSNLLQQARVRAIRDDKYYSVVTVAASNPNPAYSYIDLAQSGSYASGDPELVFNSDVRSMSRSAAPDVTNLESQFLPSGQSGTVWTSAEGPTFGPRGLPCRPSSVSGGTCTYLDTPTSYEVFMKNTRSQNWEAVTVTPAGRIRQWSHDASHNWNPMN